MTSSKRLKPDFIYFYSGSEFPLNRLSNLSEATIELSPDDPAIEVLEKIRPELRKWCPAKFASAEHLWKSLQARDRETFEQFQIHGRLGKLTLETMALVYPPSEVASKFKYWSSKNNVGIIAKLATNPKRSASLGLKMLDTRLERLEDSVETEIWVSLLNLKYKQNPIHLATLLSTGTSKLVEFDRYPKKTTHWGGQYIQGELIGENVMGRYMEIVREQFYKNSV
jgi:predicted NAD-dependent protein-ADP-ribosyltransferase YbiA (DUF1768 family)